MNDDAGPRIRAVPAVTRAVAILRLLGRSEAPLPLGQIARTLGLVPSTCLHILRALAAEELVAVDPATRRYSLDAGVLAIAGGALRRNGFARAVQPQLDRLSARHGLTAIGVRVTGLEHMVVVAIAEAELRLRLHVDLGSRFPALISATGRCLAAFGGHPWPELERRFRALRWDDPPSLEAWRADVERARAEGYALDEGNYIAGVAILAVPVLDPAGRMTHGLVAIGVLEQMRRIELPGLVSELRAIAQTAAVVIG